MWRVIASLIGQSACEVRVGAVKRPGVVVDVVCNTGTPYFVEFDAVSTTAVSAENLHLKKES